MSAIVVRAESLAKQYRIGSARTAAYDSLRDVLTSALAAPLRWAGGGRLRRPSEMIWALQDVSFQVAEGERVGIIGPNGAGKSTLLKVLSRITEPTRGFAEIYGHVGSLLEVGTGFHPELTGRENVFLNGALLGMRRATIARKFDEIVAFAEIEKFIDTPVKFYSSGMYVRLAFAVAAHLDPEILIVDEVLAVGDVRFQRKCLDLMQEMGQHGRTVLFVSHNIATVTRLCTRALLIDQGRIVADGPATTVGALYLSAGQGVNSMREWPLETAPGTDVARLLAVRVRDQHGELSDNVDIRHPVRIELEYEVLRPGKLLLPHFHLANEAGVRVFTALDLDPVWRQRPRPAGRYLSRALIPGNLLAEGVFTVHPCMRVLSPAEEVFSVTAAVSFQVTDPQQGDSARGDWTGNLDGVVRPLLHWDTPLSPVVPEARELC